MTVEKFIKHFCGSSYEKQMFVIRNSKLHGHREFPIAVGDRVIIYETFKCEGLGIFFEVLYKNSIFESVKASTTNNIF